MKRWIILFVAFLPIVLIGLLAYAHRIEIKEWIETGNRPVLPQAEIYQPQPASVINRQEDSVDELPSQKHLLVPFTTQAPDANWDMPYQEACEEASLLMVAGYYRGDTGVYDPKVADRAILDLIAFEESRFGLGPDMTAQETADVIEAYDDSLTALVVSVSSAEQIKRYVNEGVPVVVPADGKALGNPNFRNGGPVYHMLVITGYVDGQFITNDPGTRKGQDYLYREDVLMNAIHDWNGGDVPNGEPVMIIIRDASR